MLIIVFLVWAWFGLRCVGLQLDNTHIKRLPYQVLKKAATNSNATTANIAKPLTPKVYGVSLGGWLLLEPWITPSFFDDVEQETGSMPVDEYTFSQILGPNRTLEVLQNHWSNFMSETDIREIKDFGLNLVRIPIGYWAFSLMRNDPFVQGQEAYLDKAIEWCSKYSLKVQVDIHGMPGSQNGFDNSGRRTSNPFWLDTTETVNVTTYVTNYVLAKYGTNKQVDSIEMVNEPFGYTIGFDKISDYYHQVYRARLNQNISSSVNLYFHDGFMPIEAWSQFMIGPEYQSITMDHHIYEIFTSSQIALTIDEHINNIETIGQLMLQEPHESIVGEFSGALTDCAKYINGVGTGSRYDGTIDGSEPIGSCDEHDNFEAWSEEAKNDTARYLQTQMKVYDTTSKGWIFWCYKTETAIEWDFRKASSLELIPKLDTFIPSIAHESAANSTSTSTENAFWSNVASDFAYKGQGSSLDTQDHTISSIVVIFLSCMLIYVSRY